MPAPVSVAPIDILKSIPDKLKSRVAQSLDIFEKHPGLISRSPAGEIMINGIVHPQSNFSDLLCLLHKNNAQYNRVALPEFIQALDKINFPNALIGNTAINSTRAKQNGRPGKYYNLRTPKKAKAQFNDVISPKALFSQKGSGLKRKIFFVKKKGKFPPGCQAKVLRLYH